MKRLLLIMLMVVTGMFPLSAQVDSSLTEDWESGDFTGLAWERPGTQYRWEVTSEGAHSGRYCARSGNYYTLNTVSVLQLAVYLTDPGTLSYYRKVFSAEGSGCFLFWLDGELRESLAGYVEWSEFQCPISAGFHTLKFCYTKNQTKSKGSDCVWIDDIHLPNGIIVTPPSSDSTSTTEEVVIFDDVEGHNYGAVNSPGAVGWSYIDGDAAPTATYNLLNFPNEGSPMAFVVLDDYLLVGNQYNTTAHSGHKFFGSPYHSDRANDDWIVSPELDFCEPFTFSFFARSFSDRFADEKFVVAYSLTNATAASFIPLHCDTFTTTATWTEYSFMVPAQAKYVAVHCVSHDQYVFCLDDLTIRGRQSIEQSGNVFRHESMSEESNPDLRQDRDVNIVPENLDGSRDLTTHHMATTLEEMLRWNKFPTYEVYTQLLQHFQDSFPNLCQIDTILDTTPHPDLHHSIFAIHISNTLGQTTTKPAFLYSSTIHGWEVVCYYTMLRLADYILHNATTDSAVQRLLDNVDLYICPLENPDGTYHLNNDLILKDGIHSTYHNYNDVQLNCNYPYLPGIEGAANIQPETQAIIDWVTPIHFVMSVNFHCGAEIVNYPWDAWTTAQRAHADADWFRYTGQNYASLCQAVDTAYLYGDYRGRSVIEGADWSPLVGGRQDYMTYYQRCREVTIEMSYQSVITDTLVLPTFWDKSKDALLSYAMESSYGFWGTVTDALTGEPVEAMIKVVDHDYFNSEVFSHLPLGVYHRPIMAGTYTVEVSAPCYQTATFTVTTRSGVGIRHDVELLPQVAEPVAFDQYILAGMQATLVTLSQNEVWWYDSDTASQPLAIGSYFTTPVLFDATSYYLEEHYQDDTLLCVSPRSIVTVYVIDTVHLSVPNCQLSTDNYQLYIHPNPAEDYLILEADDDGLLWVEIYDVKGILVMKKLCTCPARLDITKLNAGIYFLRATHPDGHRELVKFICRR
ncbi:MAG: choice-of-anchor J domain-containing protein [Bacteroidales bacterium]|nr:choice-of-anchor J domain-containing protein [Bacteroidales bacterium]